MSRKDRRHDPETAARVTSIIEAAERAAAALIDKADANAKRYLAEAEAEADRAAAGRLQALVETADALVAQAEAVRRESLRLLESLRHTGPGAQARGPVPQVGRAAPQAGRPVQQAGGAIQGGPQSVAAGQDAGARAKHLAAVPGPESDGQAPSAQATPFPGQPAPGPSYAPRSGQPHSSDNAAGARLLATQLAVSGSSRQEIAARLRSGFQIEDPTPILDAILGPED